MDRISTLVYRLSAMSYQSGVDSVRERAKAEAKLIARFDAMESELATMRAERDRLITQLTQKDDI